jgi:hypothetical protein
MTPMLRRLRSVTGRRGVVVVMVNLSGRGFLSRRQVCREIQRPPGDSPGGQLLVEVPWPVHGRGSSTFRRSEIVAINLSYVRMASLAGG